MFAYCSTFGNLDLLVVQKELNGFKVSLVVTPIVTTTLVLTLTQTLVLHLTLVL